MDSLTEIASAFQNADQGLVQNVEALTKTSKEDRDAIRNIATSNAEAIGDRVALKTTATTIIAAINELVDEQDDLPSDAATKAEVQAVEAKVTTVGNRVDGFEPRLGIVEGDLDSLETDFQSATAQSSTERGLLRADIDKNRDDIVELKVQTLDSLPWSGDIAPTTDVNIGAPEERVRQLFLSGGVWVGDRVFVTPTAVLRRKDSPGAVVAHGGTIEGVEAFGGNNLAAWTPVLQGPYGNDIETHDLFVVPNDFETTLAFSDLGSAGLLATDAKETVVAGVNEVLRKVNEEASRATKEEGELQTRVDTLAGRLDTLVQDAPELLDTLKEIVEAFQGSDAAILPSCGMRREIWKASAGERSSTP